jgi:hypothetical protein
MSSLNRLRLKDLRDAYRLIGECRELGRDVSAWRLHMLEGLRRLTGAQVGMHLQFEAFGTSDERTVNPLDAGFLGTADRALWVHYGRENGHRNDLFRLRYYAGFTGALRTRSLESVVDAREWYSSRDFTTNMLAPAGWTIGSPPPCDCRSIPAGWCMRSACSAPRRMANTPGEPCGSCIYSTMSLSRCSADSWRSTRQTANHRCRRVCSRCWPACCRGDGEKQVAARLGLSPHTVNRHVQRLYRRYEVRSRGELLFRCRSLLESLPAPD